MTESHDERKTLTHNSNIYTYIVIIQMYIHWYIKVHFFMDIPMIAFTEFYV